MDEAQRNPGLTCPRKRLRPGGSERDSSAARSTRATFRPALRDGQRGRLADPGFRYAASWAIFFTPSGRDRGRSNARWGAGILVSTG